MSFLGLAEMDERGRVAAEDINRLEDGLGVIVSVDPKTSLVVEDVGVDPDVYSEADDNGFQGEAGDDLERVGSEEN